MGIKLYSVVIFLVLSCSSIVSAQEEQRKYVFKEDSNLVYLNSPKLAINGYMAEPGPKGSCFDLYFDTPELDLYKRGLSLRLRRREFPLTGKTYVFQLKTEPNKESAIRMEAKETELDFYFLEIGEDSISLSSLLDILFRAPILRGESRTLNKYQKELNALQNWIQIKAGGSIAPFQKLTALDAEFFTVEKLAQVQPVIIGKSIRTRTYIYSLGNQIKGINETGSVDKENDLPDFFKNNKESRWLYETWFDDAVFYPLIEVFAFKKFRIIEFGINNKLKNGRKSTALLDAYEKALLKKYNLQRNFTSKYKKGINAFQ